jgi:hypothetical protein
MQPDAGPMDVAALLPTPALDFHLGLPHREVPFVHFTRVGLQIHVTGRDARRDCLFVELYEGRNISPQSLGSLDLKLDADFYDPSRDTCIELFDLDRDPCRERPIHPVRVEETPYQKRLAMPFAQEGVAPGERFSVEMRYSYKSIVNAHLDYWFLDPLALAQSVDRLDFTAHWEGADLRQALHMTVDGVSKIKRLAGRLEIDSHGGSSQVCFSGCPKRPLVDVFVLGTAKA